jgi:hypothetical protein
MSLLEKELEWVKIGEHTSPSSYLSFEEYVDTTNTYCKQVWTDGYEEVFELAGRKL